MLISVVLWWVLSVQNTVGKEKKNLWNSVLVLVLKTQKSKLLPFLFGAKIVLPLFLFLFSSKFLFKSKLLDS